MRRLGAQKWMLVAHNGASADMMLHRLGFKPSTRKAGDYVKFFAAKSKAKMMADMDRLKAVGLHGFAKKVFVGGKPKAGFPKRKNPKPPIPSTAPSAEILTIAARKTARLKHDAERRKAQATDLSKSAAARQRRTATAEAEARAKAALLRAKGEL